MHLYYSKKASKQLKQQRWVKSLIFAGIIAVYAAALYSLISLAS